MRLKPDKDEYLMFLLIILPVTAVLALALWVYILNNT